MVSLSGEYQRLRDVGAEFITHAQWRARFDYSNERSVVEPAKQIFIHITVTSPNNYNSHAAHVRAIEAIGISRFGATGISYNRIILFGVNKPYIGQPISRRGAHTVNDHRRSTCNRWGTACPGNGGDLTAPSWNNNYTARSYAYGALTQHSVTDSVLHTFARAIADDIKAGFVRRDAKIHGHRCVSSKSCPGDHMWARMHDLQRLVNDYLEDDDMKADEREALMYIRETLANGTAGRVKHPHNDGSSSVFYGVQETWEDTWALNHRLVAKPWEFSDEKQMRWRWFPWAGYGQSRRARNEAREAKNESIKNGQKLDAILDAVGGADAAAIREHIDQRHAELMTTAQANADRLTELADGLEAAADEREELAQLVRDVRSGELSVEDLVRLMGEKLLAASDTDA